MTMITLWEGQPVLAYPDTGAETGELPGFDVETLTEYHRVWKLKPVNFNVQDEGWGYFDRRPLNFRVGALPFHEQRASCYAPRYTANHQGVVVFDVAPPERLGRKLKISQISPPGFSSQTRAVIGHYKSKGFFIHDPIDLPRHQRLKKSDWQKMVKEQCPGVEEAYDLVGIDKGNGLDQLETRHGMGLPLKGVVVRHKDERIKWIIKGG